MFSYKHREVNVHPKDVFPMFVGCSYVSSYFRKHSKSHVSEITGGKISCSNLHVTQLISSNHCFSIPLIKLAMIYWYYCLLKRVTVNDVLICVSIPFIICLFVVLFICLYWRWRKSLQIIKITIIMFDWGKHYNNE